MGGTQQGMGGTQQGMGGQQGMPTQPNPAAKPN